MIGITPYGAVQVISFNLPAYAERSLVGAALFALNYAAQTSTDTRTELGLRSDKSFAMLDAVLTLRGRVAWAHDYNLDRGVTALFQALPGAQPPRGRRTSESRLGSGHRRLRNEVA